MPFPNPDTQFKPGQSGNPAGPPKGNVHLSTMIQDYLNEDVDPEEIDPKKVGKRRMQALVMTAFAKADAGDNKWADWLAKYGYGQKFELDANVKADVTATFDPELAVRFQDFMKRDTKQ